MLAEIALAVSPRPWSHELHQFVADHGGARVRTRVMSPDEALSESYDVLIVDDVTSFVSRRLVERISSTGRFVLGVYDPEEAPEGKQRLIELGVDDVIEAGATPDEFLVAVRALASTRRTPLTEPEPATPATPSGDLVVVAGAAGGVGATEVAIALGVLLARRAPTILMDADDQSPAVAQRLGLNLHPGLRVALDDLHHAANDPNTALQALSGTSLLVLGGLATRSDWFELRPPEVVELVRHYLDQYTFVVSNIGSGIENPGFTGGPSPTGLARGLLGAADEVLLVTGSTPVGVTRLLEWLAEANSMTHGKSIRLVFNRAPRSPYQRAEITHELAEAGVTQVPVFVPRDTRLDDASWEGAPARGGPFMRSIRLLARSMRSAP